jgi:hypothetical protein
LGPDLSAKTGRLSRGGALEKYRYPFEGPGLQLQEEESTMKIYSKPTLKKHATLKQITFSSH